MNTMRNEARAAIEALETMSAGMRADFIKFDDEEIALDYAKRLAQLKPGDEVRYKGKGKNELKGVFIGTDGSDGRAKLFRYDEEKEISISLVPWGCIRI